MVLLLPWSLLRWRDPINYHLLWLYILNNGWRGRKLPTWGIESEKVHAWLTDNFNIIWSSAYFSAKLFPKLLQDAWDTLARLFHARVWQEVSTLIEKMSHSWVLNMSTVVLKLELQVFIVSHWSFSRFLKHGWREQLEWETCLHLLRLSRVSIHLEHDFLLLL